MATTVLIVDDEPGICHVLSDAVASVGLRPMSAHSGEGARAILAREPVAVLVTDLNMPGLPGLDLLAGVRRERLECKVILLTGTQETAWLARALELGAYDYFLKPLDAVQVAQAVARAAGQTGAGPLPQRAAQALLDHGQVRRIALESTRALVRAVEAKGPYTRRHSEQVAHYAVHLARHMGLPEVEVELVRVAALLHDIGKIGVPDSVLTKPGPLTPEEFALIQAHPAQGAEILRHISVFADEALLVRHHHESWSGAGFPDGLAGEAIPRGARLINVADSIDAMLMQRTYKAPCSVAFVEGELTRCAGEQFDPGIVRAALEWFTPRQSRLVAQHNPHLVQGALLQPSDAAVREPQHRPEVAESPSPALLPQPEPLDHDGALIAGQPRPLGMQDLADVVDRLLTLPPHPAVVALRQFADGAQLDGPPPKVPPGRGGQAMKALHDAPKRVRREPEPPRDVEGVDAPQQREVALGHQVVEVHVRIPAPGGHRDHQGQVRLGDLGSGLLRPLVPG
ncbi:MAG: HD domain-containing protein [Planctomycetota bacterium]|nr:HD domain-containing protein [Planctomycetota bacterium]